MIDSRVVVTDFIEPDLEWEAEQFRELGVKFSAHHLKFGTAQQLIAAAGQSDVLIVNMAKITREVMDGLERCKLIIRHGAGYDNVDIQAAATRGISVSYIPDYCVNEVAEQAIMLIFACQRKLMMQKRILMDSCDKGEWAFDPIYPVYSVRGKTLGIVGCGRIGSTVYKMTQGFGLQYLIYDPYLSERRKQSLGIETIPLEITLRKADIVTVHTPLNEETYHLLDEPQFRLMKPTAILINTARGGIVNLSALDKALKKGELAHAGIDVYEEKEPPDPDSPLLHNERATCTPHLSWLSEEAGWSIREKIVEDVRRFLKGEKPRFLVNPEVESPAA
ncbi:MAG: C-terminal binding protein [Anaerolineales bacterium]